MLERRSEKETGNEKEKERRARGLWMLKQKEEAK